MMMYFGSKWRLAPKYPAPQCDTIIEPFAGGAGYSLLHYEKNVKLYDKSPYVVAVWKFLIESTREDILNLPVVEPGEKVSEMGLPLGAEYLIRSWLDIYNGGQQARDHRVAWPLKEWPDVPMQFWGIKCRQRIADHVEYLNHWTCDHVDDYTDIPNRCASWHIDPPYQNQGKHYKYSSGDIDFKRLGEWCKSRDGHVVVCENEGADWLPFVRHCEQNGVSYKDGKAKRSVEVIWQKDL
jgi:site-specific DNA-adenine methylase